MLNRQVGLTVNLQPTVKQNISISVKSSFGQHVSVKSLEEWQMSIHVSKPLTFLDDRNIKIDVNSSHNGHSQNSLKYYYFAILGGSIELLFQRSKDGISNSQHSVTLLGAKTSVWPMMDTRRSSRSICLIKHLLIYLHCWSAVPDSNWSRFLSYFSIKFKNWNTSYLEIWKRISPNSNRVRGK